MEALFGKKKRAPGGTLVLYTSRHGATQRYAERIAQPLDALVKEAAYAKIDAAKTYDAIVLGCCVYAGKLKGLDFLPNMRRNWRINGWCCLPVVYMILAIRRSLPRGKRWMRRSARRWGI